MKRYRWKKVIKSPTFRKFTDVIHRPVEKEISGRIEWSPAFIDTARRFPPCPVPNLELLIHWSQQDWKWDPSLYIETDGAEELRDHYDLGNPERSVE